MKNHVNLHTAPASIRGVNSGAGSIPRTGGIGRLGGLFFLVVPLLFLVAATPKPGDTRVNPKDGAELVFISGGEFTMGGKGDTYGPDQEPAHAQRIAGYWMYTKEVTRSQYRKFLAANPQWAPEKAGEEICDGVYLRGWRDKMDDKAGDDLPVLDVPWKAAVAYAGWAGARLPTEAEWEFAARGGRQSEYGTATGALGAGLQTFNKEAPSPVGSHPPNPFGLYDMSGNAEELCSSLYKEYPYSADDGREDPDATGSRVTRGGAWKDCLYQHTRAAYRGRTGPSVCRGLVGFRCAVSQPEGSK